MTLSFLIFLFLFMACGVASAWKSRNTKQDYYLASSSVSPLFVGLSAVATNNSGYMFIGVIGYTYATGLASIWLMIGWISGDFLASLYVHRRLRQATVRSGEVSYAGVLSHWHGQNHQWLQRLIALVSLASLLTYAAAQLVAGSKALHVLLDWPLWSGAVAGAILVSIYCVAGGIRASIWTDVAQSCVMMVAMAVLLIVAVSEVGGVGAAKEKMAAIDNFLGWVPPELAFPGVLGGVLFAISWLFAGFSTIGQPHIMVRFMALNDDKKMRTAKGYYYLWFSLFYAMATAVGLLARLFFENSDAFDPELALPSMALELLPGVMVGLILAGIFAATMSTADSLVLSCSAAITHDLSPHKIENTKLLKMTTIAITAAALGLALSGNQSVFDMVLLAWSGLASAFAPLLLVLCLGHRPTQAVSIAAVIGGFSAAILWRIAGLNNAVYESLPGIVVGLLVFLLARFIVNEEKNVASAQMERS